MLTLRRTSAFLILSTALTLGLMAPQGKAETIVNDINNSQKTRAETKDLNPVSVKQALFQPGISLTEAIANCDAILVRLNQAIDLDLGQSSATPLPVILYLIQPITSTEGEVLVPSGSAIQAQIVRSPDSVRFVADAIMVNNQLFPFQATSLPIPVQRVETAPNPNNPIFSLGMVGGGFGLAFGGQDGFLSGQSAGQATAALLSLLITNETTVVNIPPNSEFILSRIQG
jgi:hypothetical protein